MSTFGSLTLDGVVFSASDITAGNARWVDRTGGVPAGFGSFTLQVRPPTAQTENYRAVSKFVRPILDLDGNVKYRLIADTTWVMPAGSTLAERQEFHDQWLAAAGSVPVTAAVDNVEPVNG